MVRKIPDRNEYWDERIANLFKKMPATTVKMKDKSTAWKYNNQQKGEKFKNAEN